MGAIIRTARAAMVAWALIALASCGDDGGGGGGSGERVFEVEEPGDGAQNTAPLLPMRSGSVFGFRAAAVRSPIEVSAGRVAYRYISQPNTTAGSPTAEAQSETWFSVDEDGVWFEGSTVGGLLDAGLLLVPSTVRVGMRWRTGGGDIARTYEVIRREEIETSLGPTVMWVIEQQTPTPVYRMYAEGWGLVELALGFEPTTEGWAHYSPLRAVTGTEVEAAQPDTPMLTLESVLESEAGDGSLPERFDSVRAVRLGGGEMAINVYGATQRTLVPPVLGLGTYNLLYSAGTVTRGGLGPNYFPTGTNATEIRPTPPSGIRTLDRDYEDPMAGIFGLGNVLHIGERIFYTYEEALMWENALGGLSGAEILAQNTVGSDAFELPLAEPFYSRDRPTWGAFPHVAGGARILLGDRATVPSVPVARVSGKMGELWSARFESVAYGQRLSDPVFIEAFPDAVGADLTDKRGPLISTTSSAEEQVHLFTTPAGIVDRITVDAEGARRERLGRVALPEGHELRGAADPGDGSLVVFTYAREPHTAHIWTTAIGAAAPVSPEPFVSMEWSGWDARICWPTTDEPLDGASWRLGPAAAAAVIPISDNCALVIRDLEAAPIPVGSLYSEPPPGWAVFEGAVPGVGHVRAFQPAEARERMPVPSSGAWLAGGGAVDDAGVQYSRGGVPRGTAVHLERDAVVPDQSGAGFWGRGYVLEYADGPCASPCMPESNPWAIALGGPEPQAFPLDLRFEGQFVPVRSGGVLVSGAFAHLVGEDHRGWLHLRTDGTYVPITIADHLRMPAAIAVRESGEVCGTATLVSGVPVAWCAQPDGSELREGGIPFAGGAHALSDDTMLVGQGMGAFLLDLDTLGTRPYPLAAGVTFDPPRVGADGISYGRFQAAGSSVTFGAFTADGIVPLSDIYDVEGLYQEGAIDGELTSLLVTESFVALEVGDQVLRVPRSRWGIGCEPTTAPGLDGDGDGYVATTSCGDDCDDGDDAVNPGAVDVCDDGVDNDCDGAVDVGGTCYSDGDEDGYAASGATVMSACGCPAGFTEREPVGTEVDCDDSNGDAFPGQIAYFPVDRAGGIGGSFDYDCDGVDTVQYPIRGNCMWDGSGCVKNEGFLFDTLCGRPGDYLGCPEPGMCSVGDCVDTGAMSCAVPSFLRWTQHCR